MKLIKLSSSQWELRFPFVGNIMIQIDTLYFDMQQTMSKF